MLIEITYNVTDVYMSTTETPVYVEISFEQPGGTSAVWGSITGTLSNQTDLQNALNAKFDDPTGTTAQYLRGDGTLATFPSLTGYVPYTGATTNVDLGEYELKAGQLTLDVSPTGTAAVGTTRWNDTLGSSETTLKGGSVILKNGVDLVARVVNKVSPNTTLTKAAYQAVRVSGAQGQRLAVAYAQANNDANSADTIGLVTETIATNQEGFIMTVGSLEGINTTGSLQGETWVDGDVLYLSPTTPGAITNIKPTGATGHIVVIGYVEYAHANNGKIYVKTMNGWELDELHNVSINTGTLANGDVLKYNSTTQLWENGVSAGGGISGSGTAGQVTYWSGASAVSGSSTFLWNAASNLLRVNGGIGVNRDPTGGRALDVLGGGIRLTGSTNGSFEVNGSNSSFNIGTVGGIAGINITDTNNAIINMTGNSYTYRILANASLLRIRDANAGDIDRFAIHSTGNIGIGFGSTDPAVKLGVLGDTLLRGSGATSATTALTVQNSSSTNLFTVRNDGLSTFGGDAIISKNINGLTQLQISNTTSGTGAAAFLNMTSSNGNLQIGKRSALTTSYKILNAIDGFIYTDTGNLCFFNDNASGQVRFGAGGSSTVFLTIKENGRINMSSLPTSATGLSAGDLWNDAGTIKIV